MRQAIAPFQAGIFWIFVTSLNISKKLSNSINPVLTTFLIKQAVALDQASAMQTQYVFYASNELSHTMKEEFFQRIGCVHHAQSRYCRSGSIQLSFSKNSCVSICTFQKVLHSSIYLFSENRAYAHFPNTTRLISLSEAKHLYTHSS